jgi:hypothetical protein
MGKINWKNMDVSKPSNEMAEEKERLKNAKAGCISGHKRRLREGK